MDNEKCSTALTPYQHTLCRYDLFAVKQILFCFLLLFPILTQSQSLIDQFPCRTQTKFFDFHYKSNSAKIPEIVQFSDAFINLLNQKFFKADFDYPIQVLVLNNREEFKELWVHQLHFDDPPYYGVYIPTYKLFATYPDAGIGTFTHEILHPLIERNLKGHPAWATEGIPTFFEKFYGYWKSNELVAYWGYQNPWRISQLGTNLTRIDLGTIVSYSESSTDFRMIERNESSLRMVSVFLWEQGRFKRFLKLIAGHDKKGFHSYFEAAMGMPLKQILPLWQDYLNDVSEHRSKILSLPVSTICDDEAAFQIFVVNHEISLFQPKQLD
jgi:hypothetical protein